MFDLIFREPSGFLCKMDLNICYLHAHVLNSVPNLAENSQYIRNMNIDLLKYVKSGLYSTIELNARNYIVRVSDNYLKALELCANT